MAKVLISGGKGVIGGRLTELLLNKGHYVHHLSRSVTGNEDVPTFEWDPEVKTIDKKAFDGINCIIHLAGAGIIDEKWTAERKKVIIDSRVETAAFLRETCIELNLKLDQYVSASAIGWYPQILSENVYDESSPCGTGFLADVCSKWEDSANEFNDIADNVSIIRVGIVLTKQGGALEQMVKPIKKYLGATLGTGKQYLSWIHLDDVAGIFMHSMENNLQGIYNAVGPEPCNNQTFTQTVADVLDKPIILPRVPEFVLRAVLGESAEMILNGVLLSSKKITATGYEFEYPTLPSALFNLYWK